MPTNKTNPKLDLSYFKNLINNINFEDELSYHSYEYYDEYDYNTGKYVSKTRDYENEMRIGDVDTDLPSQFSRHYEAKEVAKEMSDGSWIGWTYWYGGGKFGEPQAIDWMSEAYELSCKEEEKLIIVRTFNKK